MHYTRGNMSANSFKSQIMTLINRYVRVLPFKSVMMTSIRKRRVCRAAAILEETNIFPESRAQIVADYAHSIARTYRGILQCVNLEAVLRSVEDTGVEGAFVETGTYTGGGKRIWFASTTTITV